MPMLAPAVGWLSSADGWVRRIAVAGRLLLVRLRVPGAVLVLGAGLARILLSRY